MEAALVAGRDAAAFAPLVPYRYRERLALGLLGDELRLVGVTALGLPLGAALARLTPEGAVVESVAVAPPHRRRGVGRALLAALDGELAGVPATTRFVRETPAGEAVARILRGLGWPDARPDASQFEADRRLLGAPLLRRPDPAGVDLVPFAALAGASLDASALPEASFVASVAGEEAGRIAAHRVGPATVRWSLLVVEERFRGGWVGAALLARGLRAAFDVPGVERAVALVALGNRPVQRLVRRRLGPYLAAERTLSATARPPRAR
jgi:GNAT superfamily N-acetyltransferase